MLYVLAIIAFCFFVLAPWIIRMPADQWVRVRVVLATMVGLFSAFIGALMSHDGAPASGLGRLAIFALVGWAVGAIPTYPILSFFGWAIRPASPSPWNTYETTIAALASKPPRPRRAPYRVTSDDRKVVNRNIVFAICLFVAFMLWRVWQGII